MQTVEELTNRVAEIERVTGRLAGGGQRLDEIERQLQRLQGGSGLLEPQSSVSAWDETPPFVTASAGNPVVTYVGQAAQLLAGRSMVFERIANSPYLRISAAAGLMNVDYVVASDGSGTHLTLFGSTGAFTQAVSDQADRVIWVCTTHSETITSSIAIGGFANGQQIHVMSGGPYRPTITADLNNPLFSQTLANSGSGWRVLFTGINFAAAAGKSPSIYKISGGIASIYMEFEKCNFEGGGSWQYAVDLSGSGSATMSGMVFRNSRGSMSALAKLSGGAASTGPFVVDDCVMTLTNIFERTAGVGNGNNEVDPGSSIIISNNSLTISGSSDKGPCNIAFTVPNERVVIEGNEVLYTGTGSLFKMGTAGTSNIQDVVITNNNVFCSGSGSEAVAFGDPSALPTLRNVSVIGNALRGPGGSTAIESFGITAAIKCVFQPNGFREWTTDIASALTTTLPGPMTFTGVPVIISGNADSLTDNALLQLNTTGTESMSMSFRRSGATKGIIGIWDSTSPSTFAANDLYFTVYNGSYFDMMAFANDGSKMKLNTPLISGSYGYFGSTAFALPGNTTAGDITGTRFFVNNDSNYFLEVNAGDPRITFDSTDLLSYTRSSNTYQFQTGGTTRVRIGGSTPGVLITNYHAVGYTSAPANLTNGDASSVRLIVGSNTALAATTGLVVRMDGTLTNTASGATVFQLVQPTLSPSGNSSSDFRALNYQMLISDTNARTFATIQSGYFENRTRQDGTISRLVGLLMAAAVGDSSSPATIGTITTLVTFEPRLWSRPTGTSVVAITTGYGIDFGTNFLSGGGATITNLTMIRMTNPSTNTVTNLRGIDIEKFTLGGTLNIEFRNAGRMVYTPTTQAVAAASDTLGNSQRVLYVTVAAGGITLTSNPNISTTGAEDGQFLTVTNTDSADTLTLTNGNGVRLPGAANLALGPRDSVTFVYVAASTEWWALASENN